MNVVMYVRYIVAWNCVICRGYVHFEKLLYFHHNNACWTMIMKERGMHSIRKRAKA